MSEDKKFTQEELEEKIKERLDRQSKKHADEIAKKDAEIDKLNKDFTELKNSYANYEEDKAKTAKDIDELKGKIKGYETNTAKRKIADELGLNATAIEFIQGETEDEMKASAEKLKGLVGNSVPPLANNDDKPKGNAIDNAFRSMVEDLKKD